MYHKFRSNQTIRAICRFWVLQKADQSDKIVIQQIQI